MAKKYRLAVSEQAATIGMNVQRLKPSGSRKSRAVAGQVAKVKELKARPPSLEQVHARARAALKSGKEALAESKMHRGVGEDDYNRDNIGRFAPK